MLEVVYWDRAEERVARKITAGTVAFTLDNAVLSINGVVLKIPLQSLIRISHIKPQGGEKDA